MKKKERKTLKDELEGWLAFNGYWFWQPESGIEGSIAMAVVFVSALLAWGIVS